MRAPRQRPFEAVIADMDGVLTRTATLHERAWKQTFDPLLERRGGQAGFSSADYRAHVDGKPRYDGVADFLASRGIELPRGDPSDGPAEDTVCGVGNRKNQLYLDLLAREGAHVFEDAAAALARWRRGGLRLAVISASRNARRVLESADLTGRVEAVVDGRDAAELGLEGKGAIMREAARRLEVDPGDAVILEDASAGVRAGRAEGFGLVAGIARGAGEKELRDAGADTVEPDVYRVRFPRRVPAALERLEELAARRGRRPLAVFLDYDGTLSPIVDHPGEAWMPDETRAALAALAESVPVAVLSGRDRADVAARVGLDGLLIAGNHGFDVVAGERRHMLPDAEAAQGRVARAARRLEESVGRLRGVLIERKRFSVAAHIRRLERPADRDEVERVSRAVARETGLRRREGKEVYELEPAIDWDKGHALEWLLEAAWGEGGERPFVVYVGDDETDEDAFAVLGGLGAGVHVGPEIAATRADYRVADPEEVRALLEALASSSFAGQ